ncbi:MAG: hypothetical protein J0H15_00835 [Xanthomonadales bacterium]|nr:hypothetical protein [Xanthomonadales bacterium]
MFESRIARAAMLVACLFLAAPALARADAKADLLAAQQKMMDSRFITEIVSTSDGDDTRVEGRFDTMKRIHMVTPQAEIIVLPEGTWMKTGDSWMKSPIDMSNMIKSFMPDVASDLANTISNVKDEGMQKVGDLSLRAISYDQEMSVMGQTVKSHNTVYLDGTGRVVRSKSTGTAMGQTTSSVQSIRYDDSIRVQAPK